MPEDKPRSLRDPSERETRKDRLDAPRIQPLTALVRRIREERQEEIKPEDVPYFVPLDGGIEARCLFLLQDPGPKAVKSCSISRNNDDSTAETFFELNKAATLPREETVSWNIVPWRIGSVGAKDIEEGIPWLLQLLERLKELEVIVLVGKKAQDAQVVNAIGRRRAEQSLRLQFMPHPGPMNIRTRSESREKILRVLRDVKKILNIQRTE